MKRIRFTPTPKQPAQRASAYFTETGEAEFQQGATIVPHVLTIAETNKPLQLMVPPDVFEAFSASDRGKAG